MSLADQPAGVGELAGAYQAAGLARRKAEEPGQFGVTFDQLYGQF
jgi:hypothetical protein